MNANSLWYAVKAANDDLAGETVRREQRRERRVEMDLSAKQRRRRDDVRQKSLAGKA